MEDRDFDIIVVGSGCSGAVAAYVAAKRGKSVLVVERGDRAGAKNMTGGRIYGHSLKSLLDAYSEGESLWDSIPFERKVTHERISMLDGDSITTVEFSGDNLAQPGKDSYTVLRGTFDSWLAGLAEDEGAEYIYGIAVEEIIKDENGSVFGVRAGEDEITAHVVIDAEGVNSVLAERCLGVPRPAANEMAVGIKEVFETSEEDLEKRFSCQPGEGTAMLFVGDCTHGTVGGGFLYTNKSSISLGLVATIDELERSNTTIYQAMEDFKNHPGVAPIIKGAKMVEHSGHMVSEGGYDMLPEYVFDGCLMAGDTAMLCMNLGYQVRGMDLAVASGRFAAESACDAIDAGDVSKRGLSRYKAAMESSFVIKDMKTFSKWPKTMASWKRLFTEYPTMVGELFGAMFIVDGNPAKPLKDRLLPIIKKRGLLKLFGEARGALKAL